MAGDTVALNAPMQRHETNATTSIESGMMPHSADELCGFDDLRCVSSLKPGPQQYIVDTLSSSMHEAKAIPALSIWGVALLSVMVGFVGILRRHRQ
jgi:hypothetical protein